METDKILNLTIAKLNLSKRSQNALIRQMIKYVGNHEELAFFYENETRAITKWALRLTVIDVINKYNCPLQRSRCNLWLIEFQDKLIELGLTKLDWLALPNITLVGKLRSENKGDFKKRSILILDTVSGQMLNFLENHLDKKPKEITIEELLAESTKKWETFHDFGRSLFNTRRKLIEIGLKYEDGVFLQEGTRRQFVERLMEEEDLGKKQAERIADIARKQGWIHRSLEWNLFP